MTLGGNVRTFFITIVLGIIALWLGVDICAQTMSESSSSTEETAFVDPRDGTAYRTVQLGSQLWLSENVRFQVDGSWVYDEDPTNEVRYGRLYDWEGANCACPSGWHLPTAAEWMTLFDYLGGPDVAGGSLKEAGTGHWKKPNTDATNTSLFGGLPGGARRKQEGTFHGLGMFGAFWSSTEQGVEHAWGFYLGYHYPEVSLRTSTSKGFGFSVRCLSD